ncbi:hypothetical protein V6N12_030820 [Hibiscus sabdariffa]|uniref:Uncharacterized protein n=1 Tax=Hibiscus sabdariffa TaxID=183260 RepID=A0ABR2E749_9ROSI
MVEKESKNVERDWQKKGHRCEFRSRPVHAYIRRPADPYGEADCWRANRCAEQTIEEIEEEGELRLDILLES